MNDLQELEARVTELTNEWMNTIGPEHHKDRDCHFFIERKWSYGNSPAWKVVHNGYWIESIDQQCESYRLALQFLVSTLQSEIASAKQSIKESA